MLAHLADVSIRSLLLALSAGVALLILRSRRTAAVQHAVWTAVACGMLTLFVLGQALPRLPLRILDRPAAAIQAIPPATVVNLPIQDEASEAVQLPPLSPATPGRSIDWSEVAGYVYAAVTLAFLARFVTGMFLIRRLVAKSTSVQTFLESEIIAIPLTVGLLAPQDRAAAGMAGMGSREVGRSAGSRRRARPTARWPGGGAGGSEPVHLLVPSVGLDAGAQASAAGRAGLR